MYIDMNTLCDVCGKTITASDLVIDSKYHVCSMSCEATAIINSNSNTLKQP